MRLIAHLESALGIKIPPADLIPQNFRTIRVMAAYLASRSGVCRQSAAPGAPPLCIDHRQGTPVDLAAAGPRKILADVDPLGTA